MATVAPAPCGRRHLIGKSVWVARRLVPSAQRLAQVNVESEYRDMGNRGKLRQPALYSSDLTVQRKRQPIEKPNRPWSLHAAAHLLA